LSIKTDIKPNYSEIAALWESVKPDLTES